MGDLLVGNTDLVIADMPVTPQRAEVVDFSIPFIQTGVSIFYASTTRQEIPFHNLDELVNQNEVNYGVIKGLRTHSFIHENAHNNDTFKKMITYWEEHPEYITSTSMEGINKVVNEDRKYAFLTEAATFPMWQSKYPSLMLIGDTIDLRVYAIGLSISAYLTIFA